LNAAKNLKTQNNLVKPNLSTIVLLSLAVLFPPLRMKAEMGGHLTGAPTLSVQDLTTLAKKAETKHDHINAFRLYCAALAQDPKNKKLQNAVATSSKKAQRALEKSRERQIKLYTQDAERRLALTAAQTADLRRRLAESRKLLDAGKLFEAAVLLRQISDDAPGFTETQNTVDHLNRRLSRQLKHDKFSTPAHRQAVLGLHAYFTGDWPTTVDTLGHALNNTNLPKDLAQARLADFRASAQSRLDRIERDRRRRELWDHALAAQDAGRLEEAKISLQILLDNNPGDTEARGRLIAVEKMLAGVQQTEQEKKKQDQIPDLLTQGSLLSVQGRHADALVVFQKVLDLDPANAEARDQIADVQQAMKHEGHIIDAPVVYDNAEKAYREGLRFYGNEEYEKAKQAFQQALKLKPSHREAKEALIRLNQERPQ
jgi:tetratricopeptide (TPR) repeat protein